MKLYKFRSLRNYEDYKRVQYIITTGKFWCSKLWNLNDPMEGVYKNSDFNSDNINQIFDEKNNYLICSFSGKIGFNNPLLWGYYANGFKGVTIEVEIENKDIIKVEYVSQDKFNKNMNDVKEIITQKLNNWKHENEYRFLIESEENQQEIGRITKVFFGNPYSNLNNSKKILETSNSLRDFKKYKCKLKETCETKNIYTEDYILNEVIHNGKIKHEN
ncbi:MAG: hypothetical protein WA130_03815 [Candidatus Methanoperedens sp.]